MQPQWGVGGEDGDSNRRFLFFFRRENMKDVKFERATAPLCRASLLVLSSRAKIHLSDNSHCQVPGRFGLKYSDREGSFDAMLVHFFFFFCNKTNPFNSSAEK